MDEYRRYPEMKKVGVMIIIVVFTVFLSLSAYLMAMSPGKMIPMSGKDGKIIEGSLSEKIHVSINGVEQGMIIKGRDISNPVLLFVHGGTAMPEYFLEQKYPSGLDDYFTVCWWDRRGAGLSYSSEIPAETMTLDQAISDTIEVSRYLCERFQQNKIFLMAHSGGSLIAIQAAQQAPQLYAAYIGLGQISYQLKSEQLSYDYMLHQYRELGNKKMVGKLEKARPSLSVPLPRSYMKIRDPAMHNLGIGTMHEMKSVIAGVFVTSLLCPEYTLSEKLAIWRGKFASDKSLWDTMIALDLTKKIIELKIPTYFFHGKFDYTVSRSMAREFLEQIKSPVKGFYTFENSAHSPMFEEPLWMKEIILNDIIPGTNSLCDENQL